MCPLGYRENELYNSRRSVTQLHMTEDDLSMSSSDLTPCCVGVFKLEHGLNEWAEADIISKVDIYFYDK